jgi:hypothetical protein
LDSGKVAKWEYGEMGITESGKMGNTLFDIQANAYEYLSLPSPSMEELLAPQNAQIHC